MWMSSHISTGNYPCESEHRTHSSTETNSLARQILFARWPNRENTFHSSDWLIAVCLCTRSCASWESPQYFVTELANRLTYDVTVLLIPLLIVIERALNGFYTWSSLVLRSAPQPARAVEAGWLNDSDDVMTVNADCAWDNKLCSIKHSLHC